MNQSMPTRDRLLTAARQLFAERGIVSASVRAITRAAHANLGAVTYHFGSKDRLRDAVLDQLYGHFVDRVMAAAATPGPAPDRLARIVQAIFGYFAENPDTPRILIQVLAANARDPYPAAIVAQQRRLLQAMTGVVQEGIAAAELRKVNPVLVAFTIMSQSVWFAIVRQQIAAMSGVPFDRPEMASAVEHHITEVVTRGLAPA
jgi:TetR/AcrR family transcriptional regulator, regulator of cefoperazone and chloramphenicol sensitivity